MADPATPIVLLADIGGTNSRFALAGSDGRPTRMLIIENDSVPNLEGAIARLPPALSEVFHLRTSGLSYEEIADVLEIPLGTLKSRMNQMVTQLREELRPWTAG